MVHHIVYLMMATHDQQRDDTIEFLNEQLFHSIISKIIKTESFKIIKLENGDGLEGGKNFISKIIKNVVRIQLNDKTEKEYVFISKLIGSVLVSQDIVDEMEMFPKEVAMYRDVVPEFETILQEEGSINVSFGPKLYHYELEPHKMLIFENLKVLDYEVMNPYNGLTEPHVLLVLEKIAKWHAASRVYYERHAPIDKMLTKGLIHAEMVDYLKNVYNLMHKNLVDGLEKTDIDKSHLAMIKSWTNNIIPTIAKITTVDPDEFNALNHGDLWINNIMFLHGKSGSVKDVKFIDYQLGNYGSVAFDLYYFLLASLTAELFTTRFDYFIAYYHRHLVETLKRLNHSRIPTLKEIHVELLKKSHLITAMVLGGLPNILSGYGGQEIDITHNHEDNAIGYANRQKMIENPIYMAKIKSLIKFMGNRGMLEL